MKNTTLLVAVLIVGLWCHLAAHASGAESIDTMPPVVVKTVPEAGNTDVAPGVTEIQVMFSKEMTDGSWSWSSAWKDSTPEFVGKPRYDADHRTCVVTVRLEPGKTYGFWLNSSNLHNFRDTADHPAIPYLLVFQTRAVGATTKVGGAETQPENVSNLVRAAVTTISTCAEGDPKVAQALATLKGIKAPAAVAETAKYLASDEDNVRRAAIYVLWLGGFTSIDAAVKPLMQLCVHKEDLTRGMAALALGANHAADCETVLIAMATKDSSPYARRCAAYALGLLGKPDALPALQKVAADPDPLVANNAKAAIKMLSTATTQPVTTEAAIAAESWLKLADAGRYDESWNELSAVARKAIAQADWAKALGSARKPLGKVVKRKLKSAEYATTLPGAPDGHYVVLQYDTEFENKKAAVETVTPMKDADGIWRVGGYYVK